MAGITDEFLVHAGRRDDSNDPDVRKSSHRKEAGTSEVDPFLHEEL